MIRFDWIASPVLTIVPWRAMSPIAVIKGAGDLGTGVAYRLWKCGFCMLCTRLRHSLYIRVCFGNLKDASR